VNIYRNGKFYESYPTPQIVEEYEDKFTVGNHTYYKDKFSYQGI
jgi:hypothetical protein